jgi:hypothetical protein
MGRIEKDLYESVVETYNKGEVPMVVFKNFLVN